MLYDQNHPEFGKLSLVDAKGVKVPLVHSFNDETGEAVLFIKNAEGRVVMNEDGEPAKATLTLKGAKIVRRNQ